MYGNSRQMNHYSPLTVFVLTVACVASWPQAPAQTARFQPLYPAGYSAPGASQTTARSNRLSIPVHAARPVATSKTTTRGQAATAVQLIPPARDLTADRRSITQRTSGRAYRKPQTFLVTDPEVEDAVPLPVPRTALNDAPTQGNLPALGLPSVTDDLNRRQQERVQTYQQLQDKLKQLMLREKKTGTREARAQSEQETPAAPESTEPTSAKDDTAAPDPVVPTQETLPEQATPDVPPMTPTPAAGSRKSMFAEGTGLTKILDGPVDAVAMADNLYAWGDVAIALKVYQEVDMKELSTDDKFWVYYQMASCYRRLNQIEKAQELYRRIAGQQKQSGSLGKLSVWWLSQIQYRNELATTIAQQAELLAAVRSAIAPPADDQNTEEEVASKAPPGI